MFEPDNEQLQAVIIASDTVESLADLSSVINDDALGVKIDPLGLYCQKTGAQIGTRSETSIFSFFKIHGKNDFIRALYNSTGLSVSPAWIETNGDDLDVMLTADPIGYAVYCFGLMTAQFYVSKNNQNPKLQPWSERHWAMARANALLQAKGVAELTELNLELCRFIGYMPDTTNYLFRKLRKYAQTPDQLALLHCSGELIALLRDTINKTLDSLGHADMWIKRTRFIDIAATPGDAARGPSNIRKQKTSARKIKEDTMFFEMQAMFKDAGIEFDGLPGTTKWREKYMNPERIAAQEAKEEEMLTDLRELAKLTNLALPEGLDEEDDDQTVEVHSLALPVVHELTNAAYKVDACTESGPVSETENETGNNINSIETEIARDIIETIHEAPINSIMVEIAKAVLENVVQTNVEFDDFRYRVDTAPILVPKPMTALEILRARKGAK